MEAAMSDVHIEDFLKTHSQREAAEIMGVTPGAVSQAFISKRDIYFRPDGMGGFTHYEIKRPRQKKAA